MQELLINLSAKGLKMSDGAWLLLAVFGYLCFIAWDDYDDGLSA